ncbi:MAG: hypothetical protein ACK528_00680 [Alphaproteobacteria bacterium]|jgi:hypothetical protein
MPKYTLEIGGKTYDIESDKSLSDADLAGYAAKIAGPAAAPAGQIPGPAPGMVAPPPSEIPLGRRLLQAGRENIQQIGRALQPTAEMLAAAGGAKTGAAMAAPFAPMAGPLAPAVPAIGGFVGGVLGYTGAKSVGDVLQGQAADVVGDIRGGAVAETVGRVAGPVLGAVGRTVAKFGPEQRAARIAQEAAGKELPAIREAVSRAEQQGLTPAQATAGVPRQAWQSLLALGKTTDESFKIAERQVADAEADLARMVGGANQAEARRAVDEARKRLSELTTPMRETELGAANLANKVLKDLEPRAAQKQQSMVSALQQAGRTETEAAQRAAAAAQQLQRVTPGQIPAVSATQAARTQGAASRQWQETSNTFADIAGQRRAERDFINRQIGSLEAYGLRPLDINPVVASIDQTLSTPGLRASNDVTRVMAALKDDMLALAQRNGGVIDAHDLYTLRKEGVAQRVRDVLKLDDPKAGAKVTAAVVDKLRPAIDNAIEQAGGTGWRQYLDTYSKGMDVINQRAMAAEALRLFKDSPQEYVRLVRNNRPESVEAIFGPGRYDIFKEMSSQMPTLDKVAKQLELDVRAAKMATGGADDFANILEANRAKMRIPNWFSPAITAANMKLADVEKRVNKKTIDIIRNAASSGQSLRDLLDGLPTTERTKLMRLVNSSETWAPAARAATTTITAPAFSNALAPESENVNALAR